MKASLIVGAAGQVGAQILSVLGPTRAIPTSRVPRGPGWVELDLAAIPGSPAVARDIIAARGVSAVYCVGGMTDVERCESEPAMAMDANCHGPAAMAAAAELHQVPFVYFSTEYVFDGASGPYAEEATPNPINVYGRSKWLGEQAILRAHSNPLIIRTTVVYGNDPRKRNFLYGLQSLLAAGRVMRVAADQISTPTYNRDLANVAINLVQTAAHGIFHVAGPERMSRYEFATRAARALNLDTSRIVPVSTQELRQVARRPLDAGLSTAKLRGIASAPRMRGTEEAVKEWASEMASGGDFE